jgi:thymidylate synthase (FAD)
MKISDIEVSLVHHVGDDLDVVNAARVSFDKESEWEKNENSYGHLCVKDERLISYLAKHKHHSPFNHSFLSFRIKAPIFVARQLVKHKFMPWNEVSRRYVDSEPEFYIPELYRLKADNVKQGSSEEVTETFVNPWGGELCQVNAVHTQHIDACLVLYQGMLDSGICPEQARMVLPQNTMTEWRWSGTLGAFLDMLVLRLNPHTQKETRDVAEKIAVIIKELFPVSYSAYLGE